MQFLTEPVKHTLLFPQKVNLFAGTDVDKNCRRIANNRIEAIDYQSIKTNFDCRSIINKRVKEVKRVFV